MAQSTLTHPNYKFVDEKDADAVAWAFLDKDTMKQLPFKFPELKSNEIRAKVTYTGLCLTDHYICHGDHFPVSYPICPGHEIVGVATHLGKDVKDFKIGDRVGFGTHREFCESCEFCNLGHDQMCRGKTEQVATYGDKYWGGWATSIQHPAQAFFKLPNGLPDEKIAPLFCAGITCFNPVAKYAKPGQEVAVLGIGGLGHMAVQYAKAWGCKVTAFTTTLEKEDFIKKLGADRVVINSPETLKQEFERYHLVINTLPATKDLNSLVMIVRPLGVFCQVGAPTESTPFNPTYLLYGSMNFVGSNSGSTGDIREMLEFSAKHNIVPLCEEFDWEDFPKAYDRLVNGKPIFRCVVNVSKAQFKKN